MVSRARQLDITVSIRRWGVQADYRRRRRATCRPISATPPGTRTPGATGRAFRRRVHTQSASHKPPLGHELHAPCRRSCLVRALNVDLFLAGRRLPRRKPCPDPPRRRPPRCARGPTIEWCSRGVPVGNVLAMLTDDLNGSSPRRRPRYHASRPMRGNLNARLRHLPRDRQTATVHRLLTPRRIDLPSPSNERKMTTWQMREPYRLP